MQVAKTLVGLWLACGAPRSLSRRFCPTDPLAVAPRSWLSSGVHPVPLKLSALLTWLLEQLAS